MMPLPRYDRNQSTESLLLDLYNYLVSQPQKALRVIEVVGDAFPLYVDTPIANPAGVTRLWTRETDTGNPIAAAGIGWTLSDLERQPGIKVTAMDGLTAGVNYSVCLEITSAGGAR